MARPSDPDQCVLAQSGRAFFALLTERQIRRGIHRSVGALQTAITLFIDQHNANPKPFRWTKSADDILASIERFCLYNAPLDA
jgi:hypothetical protein